MKLTEKEKRKRDDLIIAKKFQVIEDQLDRIYYDPRFDAVHAIALHEATKTVKSLKEAYANAAIRD